MMEGGVQINARGRRFHDETQGYSEAAVHVLAQPGGIAWNVFDDRCSRSARGFPDFVDAEAAGARAPRAPDAAGARARSIGCDAATLAATLATARGCAPPYHAVKVTGALFHTQGGLDIDARLPRAARRRHAAAQPAGRRRRGARRLGQRGLGLSLRQRPAQRRRRRLHRRAHAPAASCKDPTMTTLKQRLARAAPLLAPGVYDALQRAGRRAGRLRGAVPLRRLDRLHAARPLRRRPDHRHRGRGHARAHHRARARCR